MWGYVCTILTITIRGLFEQLWASRRVLLRLLYKRGPQGRTYMLWQHDRSYSLTDHEHGVKLYPGMPQYHEMTPKGKDRQPLMCPEVVVEIPQTEIKELSRLRKKKNNNKAWKEAKGCRLMIKFTTAFKLSSPVVDNTKRLPILHAFLLAVNSPKQLVKTVWYFNLRIQRNTTEVWKKVFIRLRET